MALPHHDIELPLAVAQHIQHILKVSADELGLGTELAAAAVTCERPTEEQFGDYSTNAAMMLYKTLTAERRKQWNSPRAFAAAWVKTIIGITSGDHHHGEVATANPKRNAKSSENEIAIFEKVDVAGPGFINFTVSRNYLLNFALACVQSSQKVIKQATTIGASAHQSHDIIEYVGPNTNKPLHVGHLRNAVLGKSMILLREAIGHDVTAATINNDRGLHITKSMWGYVMHARRDSSAEQTAARPWSEVLHEWMETPTEWMQPAEMSERRLQKPDHFVGYWYTVADKFAEDQQVLKTWQEMLHAWEQADHVEHAAVRQLWKHLNDWFYEGYRQTTQRLGIAFDPAHISYESEIYEAGRKIIVDGAKRGLFERAENGAVIARLQKHNLPDKVLLRGDGTGIYMTFDIELTRQRIKTGADLLVWVVGMDQTLYFQQLFAVAEELGFGHRDRFKHFAYGMVRLPEGKMSSRKGRVVYADDVLDSAVQRAYEVMAEVGVSKSLSETEKRRVAEAVGVGAVKWGMLAYDPSSEVQFDLHRVVSFQGNSGPYMQYTFARTHALLAKAGEVASDTMNKEMKFGETEIALAPTELALLRWAVHFGEVVRRSAVDFSPHLLCGYLFELAQRFNAFYQNEPVLDAPEDVRRHRLLLVASTHALLKTGLELLGIAAIERM